MARSAAGGGRSILPSNITFCGSAPTPTLPRKRGRGGALPLPPQINPTSSYFQNTSRSLPYFAAITMISTVFFGDASLASTVARAGVLPVDTQGSHTAFISAKVPMSER